MVALRATLLLFLTLPVKAQPAPPESLLNSRGVFSNQTARPLRYQPDHGDFVLENGGEFFNRPLYCRNGAFRVDGGDKPEFSLYVPGRGGNLRLGIKTAAGVKWLNDAANIVTRYRPGSLLYEIRDPWLGHGELNLTVLPLDRSDGLIARIEPSRIGDAVELICAFGGANGMRGRRGGDIGCESEPISRFFQLHPEQCRSNEFSIGTNGFLLKSRVADVAGIFSADTQLFVSDATQWNSPAALIASPDPGAPLPVVVGRMRLSPGQPVYLALERIDSRTGSPAVFRGDELLEVFESAERHRRDIAGRVVVETPDPFINAAAGALNVAADAIWDERQQSFMHGAVAWRVRLLGWRGPYAGDVLGWHERTAAHFAGFAAQQNTNPVPDAIPPADANANLARNETALHSNGDLTRSHYDMNLVAVDAFFRHLLWTGDLEFARREWPVIERHLAWERRLFRRAFGPDALPLYEAYNCIWASDNMEFDGGGAAHSSAYNYFENKMAARVAALIGRDAAPYGREADLIRKGMRKYLWLPDRGWFAEWKDFLGLQLAHPNPGLWTFYHTIDSEVTTPLEAWQMTRFVDTQIAHIPVQIQNSKSETRNRASGLPVPSETNLFTLPTTGWMPYQWSLNNVVMAEAAHASLAYWEANRPETAFALFKGCLLDSMFLGACPGNLGMSTHFDMARGESQRDFGDAIGVCSRAMIEGLFGIHPDALAGELRIEPGFPSRWNAATIRHPDFTFAFERSGLTEKFRVQSRFPGPLSLSLRIPALRDRIGNVTVNGRPAKWRTLEDCVGAPRVEIQSAPATSFDVVVSWRGERPDTSAANQKYPVSGREFGVVFERADLRSLTDEQGVVNRLALKRNAFRAEAAGSPGYRTLFAKLEQGDLKWWQPVTLDVRPPFEIVSADTQNENHLRFRIRNHTPDPVHRHVTIRFGRVSTRMLTLKIPPLGDSDEIELPDLGLVPGSNPVTVRLDDGQSIDGVVTNWKIPAPAAWREDTSRFAPGRAFVEKIDLDSLLNDRVTQIFRNRYVSPRSPFCSLAIPSQGIGGWADMSAQFDVDDSGIRAVAGKEGGKLLVQGVPFKTPGDAGAKNILFVSQWDNYPREASVPLSGRASHLYLLMAGSSNPMQSRFDNGEVVVTYADGSTNRLALHNPVNWWPIDQDYFIDDFAFRREEPIPPRVDSKTGQVRILDAATFKGKGGGRIPGGAATVLDLPLNPDKPLKSIAVRALANEVVIGLMAATLVR